MEKIKMQKKKSFWKILTNEFPGILLFVFGIVYIGLSFLFGNFILPTIKGYKYDSILEITFKGFAYLTIFIFGFVFVIGVIWGFVIVLNIIIRHIIAIKRYTYLPLKTDEVQKLIDAGIIENNPDSYTDYLVSQVRYINEGVIMFSNNDMEILLHTYKELWNSPIVLTKEFLERNKIRYYYLNPFTYENEYTDSAYSEKNIQNMLEDNWTITYDNDANANIIDEINKKVVIVVRKYLPET